MLKESSQGAGRSKMKKMNSERRKEGIYNRKLLRNTQKVLVLQRRSRRIQ